MRWSIPAVLTLALFVAVSCDQQPVEPTGEQSVAEAPTFDWMNNPDNGNEKVYRSYEDFIICFNDDKLPLRACHGNVPIGGGPDPIYNCGLQGVEAPTSYQDVGVINDDDFYASDFHKIQKGDVWVTIRDMSQPGDCVDNALVAEGWAKFVGTDNDVFGAFDDKHTNVWTNKFQGQLMTPSGEKVAYSAVGQHSMSARKDFRAFHKIHLH